MINHLNEQVEKIIDEGTGRRRSVIVRMASPEEALTALSSTTSNAIQKRNLAISARDVLPLPLDKIRLPESGERSAYEKRVLRAEEHSVTAQVAVMEGKRVSSYSLKRSGLKVLKPLITSDLVQKSKVEVKVDKPEPDPLWISNSLALDMSKGDLVKLPSEVPQIEAIYPNRRFSLPPVVVPKDLPKYIEEYKSSAWGVMRIGALACWGAYGARGSGVNVGLLDTGVDASHPDLNGKIVNWAEFDSDGRLVVDSQPHDSDEHGTHCAGIIAGGNNSGQWIGVAPEATISAALVINSRRGGTDAQVLAGIQWAAEQGVDVINMSLGGVWFDPEVRDDYMNSFISCLRLGIPVVVAIGNSGHQTTGTPGNDFFAFSVGATDHKDLIAGFSGGRTHIIRDSNVLPKETLPLVYSKPDVSAPGVAIKSCTPRGQWKPFNGTSMAAPHVSGAIALLLSATSIRKDVERNQRAFLVQDLLISSVKEMGESGQDHRYGFGRIDTLRAIDFAQDLGY
jgi:subtilisin family serine protease